MDRYPYYFEATFYDEMTSKNVEEGGFIVATSYNDAMYQITELYEPGLIDVKLECLDDCALFFDRETARKFRKMIEEA